MVVPIGVHGLGRSMSIRAAGLAKCVAGLGVRLVVSCGIRATAVLLAEAGLAIEAMQTAMPTLKAVAGLGAEPMVKHTDKQEAIDYTGAPLD
jgi:hypothetical protein